MEKTRHIRGKARTDREIAQLADAQHGVVATWQLALGDDAIQYRARIGRLHRKHRGVYAVGRSELTPKGHWMAAALAYGPDAVISHRTAAALWGIGTSTWKIDVTTAHSKVSRDNVRHHTAPLPPEDVTIHDGIPVTTIARTILDVAAKLRIDPLTRVLESADRAELADLNALNRVMASRPRAPGIRKLKAVLNDYRGTADTRSRLERDFRALIHRAKLPEPQFNVLVAGVLADVYWPQWRLVVEIDHPKYHSSPRAFENDRLRDIKLMKAGYRVIRVTAKRLNTEPAAVLADIKALAALGQR
jgi:very-short-patch-repair endonuclease